MNNEENDMENEDLPNEEENLEVEGSESAEEAVDINIKSADDEIAELKDKLLRSIAESENLRRRGERQVSDAAQYAVTSFARDLLSVSDNLRRTLDTIPEEMREEEAVKVFVEGLEMTERELLNVFDKQGITKITPDGEKFDHNFHQAMFEVENPAAENGTIIQVIQPGYVLKERLLRPAMVGVVKNKANDKPHEIDETA
ncbi:MAG: nucleotide exchange factor GrpE [Sphingomonadales bacterium]|nr:nucleotide exchange factor GrpE [Sphingomonadales bacterium]